MREVERPLRTTDFEGREAPDQIPPLDLVSSAALFAVGALLLFLTTRLAVPTLVSATGAEPVVMWFLAASAVLFGPLLLTAALVTCIENGVQEDRGLGLRGCGFTR